MLFKDEYEFVSEESGSTYYVYQEGELIFGNRFFEKIINYLQIFNEDGSLVEEGDADYDEIYCDAQEREFPLEVHSRDFDREDVYLNDWYRE